MVVLESQFLNRIPMQPIGEHALGKRIQRQQAPTGKPFSAHLQQAQDKPEMLIVSKHANQRMEQRKIHISSGTWKRIEAKVLEAKQKGINDSLVLLDQAAMIVSSKNNTVITVMDRKDASNQIFTNIDGTIILD